MPRFDGDFLFCWTAIWELLQTHLTRDFAQVFGELQLDDDREGNRSDGARTEDQDPRQSSNRPESRQDAEAAKRAKLCNQQRALLARLKQSPPSFTLNEKGEQIPLDNSAAIARQEKLTAEQCRL